MDQRMSVWAAPENSKFPKKIEVVNTVFKFPALARDKLTCCVILLRDCGLEYLRVSLPNF